MFSLAALRTACWATRTFHSFPGRWRLVRWITARYDDLTRLTARSVRIARGCRMYVQPGDSQGRPVYLFGVNPRDYLTIFLEHVLEPGDCVLDVGASFGYYAIVASRLAGPNGCAHAFEASPPILKFLRENARLSRWQNVTVHAVAVSDRDGEAAFHIAADALSGLSSMRALGEHEAGAMRVPTITIDSLLDTIPRTKLVKIDIEGAELLAIKGMERLLDRDRPFLVTDVNDAWYRELGTSAEELWELLSARGYQTFAIGPHGLRRLERPPTRQGNIVCLPPHVPTTTVATIQRALDRRLNHQPTARART